MSVEPGSGTARRVLVIKHGAFGDVIQADGALRDIRTHHGEAVVTVLTRPAYGAIFARSPWIDAVLLDERAPRWRLDRMVVLGRTLRAGRFDQVYDLQGSVRTAFYRDWLLPDVPWSGDKRRRTLVLRPRPQTVPILRRMAEQLATAGVAVEHTGRPDVCWMADDVSDLLERHAIRIPFVMLIPGSSAQHLEKRWPFYPALAEALLAQGWAVVSAPGPDEATLALPGIVLPPGCLTWFQLAGLMARAAFVVGNDTGPTHLAAHSGASGLALYGPRHTPAMTGLGQRKGFEAVAVPDLAALTVERVLATILTRIGPGPGASPPP